MSYVKRFNEMVAALRAHPDIDVVKYEVADRATADQLEAANKVQPLTAEMRGFYQECNGLKLEWKCGKFDEEITGFIELWPIQHVFGNHEGSIWGDGWGEEYKQLHPLDHWQPEACAALNIDGSDNPKVFYHYCGEYQTTLDVDFAGYLELLLKSRGFWYWPKAIAAPEYFNEYHPRSHEEEQFRTYMPQLFDDYEDSDFARLDGYGSPETEETDVKSEEGVTVSYDKDGNRVETRIIEGKWQCAECDSEGIRGRLKRCPYCGSPRDDSEKFDFGERDADTGRAKAETVIDVEGLSMAGAGADWYCANCDSSNPAGAAQCQSCGSSAEFAALEAPLPPPEPPPPPPEEDEAEASAGAGKAAAGGCMGFGALGVFGFLAFICAGVVCWGMQSREAGGQVTAMAWELSIHHERFTEQQKLGWKSDLINKSTSKMPTNGKGEKVGVSNIHKCKEKVRKEGGCETKTKQVKCGTKKECKQVDQGNGFAKEVCKDVPKYCDEKYEECWEPEVDQWCTYDTYAWKRLDTRTAKGADKNPAWPAPFTLDRYDRDVREETYSVDVAYDDGGTKEKATFNPAKEAEFKRFDVGMDVVVTVSNMGSVTDVRPVGDKP